MLAVSSGHVFAQILSVKHRLGVNGHQRERDVCVCDEFVSIVSVPSKCVNWVFWHGERFLSDNILNVSFEYNEVYVILSPGKPIF